MILHTLCLSGWRCFGRKLHLGPMGPGLNIIHGPNGTGKSTLLEALSRGLLDAHGVKGRQIEAIAPWGRALSPAVTLEFSHAGERYRMEKTFLAAARVRLDVKVGARFEPLAEGRAADERIRAMFTRNPPARGLAQFQHRGWTQVLWAAQSETRLAALSDDLAADLRGVLDAQLKDPLTQAVLETVASRYGRDFTAGGRRRRGQGAPEIDLWQGELRTIQAELVPAEAELARHGTLSAQVQGLEDRQCELSALHDNLKAERDALETAVARYREMTTRLDRQQSRAREAEALHHQLKQQRSLLKTTARELQESKALVRTLADEIERQRKGLEALEEEDLSKRREAEALGEMATQAAELRKQAEAAQNFLTAQQRAERLARTLSRVRKIETQLKALAQQRQSQPGPDEPALAQARKLQARHHVLEGRLAAQGVTLELTAEQALTLEVSQGKSAESGEGNSELAPGASISLGGTPDVAARIPGIARFTVKGAGEDWASLKAMLDGVTAELTALFKPFGAGRVEELESLATRDRELTAQESELRTELRTLLEGAQTEALETELGSARQILRDLIEAYPQWTDQAPDGKALSQEAGRQQAQVEARRSAVETAGTKARQVRDQASA
ncbi:MAG: AAA family ATPase, partial [Desulfobacterales bacterium]